MLLYLITQRDAMFVTLQLWVCVTVWCVLVMLDDGIYLWNPSTRESKKLPLSGIEPWPASYGFGYDQTNDDYKVVQMMVNFMGHCVKKGVKVFSLNTDSWRTIRDFPFSSHHDKRGIYVDGVLHWMVELSGGSNSSMVIVSLDLGKEVYGEIAPPCLCESDNSHSSVGVLEGCLSVFYHYNEPQGKHCVDIWVMKAYGVGVSWTKLYTIPYTLKPDSTYYYPLCITMTGEILLKRGWHLNLYNPTSGRFFRNLKIGKLSSYLVDLNVIAHVDSLVSLIIDEDVLSPHFQSKITVLILEIAFSYSKSISIHKCSGHTYVVKLVCHSLYVNCQLSKLFTTDSEVIDAVSNLTPLLAISIFLNGIQPILSGNMVGNDNRSSATDDNFGDFNSQNKLEC